VVHDDLAAEARAAGGASPFPARAGTSGGPPGPDGLPARGANKVAFEHDERTDDLRALYADIPLAPDGLRAQCDALRAELRGARARRRDALEGTVRVRTEASTSERMHAYRKLIGAACGGVPPAEVDAYVGMLLEVRLACAPFVRVDADAPHHRRSSRRSRPARRRWRGAAHPRRRRHGHERGGARHGRADIFIHLLGYVSRSCKRCHV
jgi:hypothetical protein